jgi:hypothetical protein
LRFFVSRSCFGSLRLEVACFERGEDFAGLHGLVLEQRHALDLGVDLRADGRLLAREDGAEHRVFGGDCAALGFGDADADDNVGRLLFFGGRLLRRPQPVE